VLSSRYIPTADFTPHHAPDDLGVYLWNEKVLSNYFCRSCGIFTVARVIALPSPAAAAFRSVLQGEGAAAPDGLRVMECRSPAELVRLWAEGVKAGEDEDMKEAFRVFDENGDGFISAAELQAVLKKLGLAEARSLAAVQEMICNVDRDRDGQVDFGEFKTMMQGITVWGA
jgi:hypothetical protein